MRTSQFASPGSQQDRDGNIVVISAFVLIMVFGFTAFAVDMGYITLTKSELQKSADGAALGALIEMYDGWGKGATSTPDQVATASKAASVAVGASNRAGGLPSVYVDGIRDVRLGQYTWDPVAGQWNKSWGVSPYNLVEVTVHRDQAGSTNGDRPLDLFFAPVIGQDNANTSARAVAALLPGTGVKKVPGVNVGILPITLDQQTWDDLIYNNVGADNYYWNESTKTVSVGADGVREINLYPSGAASLPPGNRGTVDFGSAGNSTADISRQIRYGLNDADLAYFGGSIDFQNDLPMTLNGDTGLSAGIKDDLEAVKGEPKLIPIFSAVSGPGNNANYTIVKFVPIRILYVKLVGSPSSKKVIIQPAAYYSPTVTTGEGTITNETVFGPATLIE